MCNNIIVGLGETPEKAVEDLEIKMRSKNLDNNCKDFETKCKNVK